MKDESKEYRNAALDFASAFVDVQAYIELVKTMDKAKPEPKIDILNWLGREAKDSAKRETLQKLMIRFDLPAKNVLLDQIGENYAVSEAAVWALTRIGDVSLSLILLHYWKTQTRNMVLLAQDALSVFRGDISDAVVKSIARAGAPGKVAGIELLAMRRYDAKINTVLDLTNSSDKDVKTAAYTALKSLATAQDFTQLCGMLESTDEYVLPMQEAVSAAVLDMPRTSKCLR